MSKSESKQDKTIFILPYKKEDTQSSQNSFKQFIDNSIAVKSYNRFLSTWVYLVAIIFLYSVLKIHYTACSHNKTLGAGSSVYCFVTFSFFKVSFGIIIIGLFFFNILFKSLISIGFLTFTFGSSLFVKSNIEQTKMKSYVAVQKKLLTTIYHLWKKNEQYNPNYIFIIQEKEQELSSLRGFAKAASAQKNSPNQVETIQGKHPVKNHSKLPLC